VSSKAPQSEERVLGHFVLEGEIGRGGMGVVYRGRQQGLDRPAVLKKLRKDLASDADLVERFEREARAAAAIHHHNVVAVYDCFTHRGEHWIAQEYVEGSDLKAALQKAGALPPREAALIALEILRGLEEIHAAGTVHRDLKPANILLGRRGEVKVADFGLALRPKGPALTQPGVMLGTPSYMPPEQMLGERVDARGDLFSWGVVLYEMLAGVPPYPEPGEGETESLLVRMQRERYAPLRRRARRVPLHLRRLVRRSLRSRPKQRPTSSTELRRALERRWGVVSPADARAEIARFLWHRGVFAERDDATRLNTPAATPRRGRPALRWAAALLAVALLAGTVLFVRAERVRPLDALGAARLLGSGEPADSGRAPAE
jgi:eukaryotic-like serine/threonine-protein kinase